MACCGSDVVGVPIGFLQNGVDFFWNFEREVPGLGDVGGNRREGGSLEGGDGVMVAGWKVPKPSAFPSSLIPQWISRCKRSLQSLAYCSGFGMLPVFLSFGVRGGGASAFGGGGRSVRSGPPLRSVIVDGWTRSGGGGFRALCDGGPTLVGWLLTCETGALVLVAAYLSQPVT